MNTFSLCAFLLLNAAVVRANVDCVIENPTMCDASAAQVVKKFTINSTCSDQMGQELNLEEGETYKMNAEFVPDEDVEEAQSVAVLFGDGAGMILTDEPACDQLECPLKANETYNLKAVFTLKQILSPIDRQSVVLSWALVDGKSMQNIFCLRVPANVTKPTDAPLLFQPEIPLEADP